MEIKDQIERPVLLVRHAKSEINFAYTDAHDKGASYDEIKNIISDRKYRDCELSQEGLEQCAKEAKLINSINVHTVFISPLRRALQTAVNLFKNHPNFESIKFILLPAAREAIEGADDLPWNIDSILSEFGSEFPNLCTSHFDKYENKVNYIFEDLDEPLKAELIAKIKLDGWNQAGKVFET